MPRRPRIEYAGAVYHVMSRGVKGTAIFKDAQDHECFLITLGEVCKRTGWRIHAYVLMRNHYHALLETPEGHLVAGMKWFLGAYAQHFNVRHGERGQVFQGRYKALNVDPEEEGHFESVSAYIHLNPVRARIIRPDHELAAYRWSSYPAYLVPKRKRPKWLHVSRVLGDLGMKDDASGRRDYDAYIEERIRDWRSRSGRRDMNEEWSDLRRGWCLGGESFREKLLARLTTVMNDRDRASYSGEAVELHDEAQAEALVRVGLAALKMREDDLRTCAKSDLRKCALAWFVHEETMASHKWIAARLNMGNPSNLTRFISHMKDTKSQTAIALRKRLTVTRVRKDRK